MTQEFGAGRETADAVIRPLSGDTNHVVRVRHPINIACIRFSPDGQLLATSALDSTSRIWDATTGQPVGAVMRHENWPLSIDFSPEGQRVVTAAKDHTVRVWDALTGLPLSEPMRHDAPVLSARFSPDGQRILSLCAGVAVWVWEVRGGQPLVATLQHKSSDVRKAVFSTDGRWVGTVASEVACVWNALEATPRTDWLAMRGTPRTVQFSADGRLFLAADDTIGGVIWDAKTGVRVAGSFNAGDWLQCARFSPDEQHILTAGRSASVKLWRIADQMVVREFRHEDEAEYALFSPNGAWLVTTSKDKTARVWDWRTGQPLLEPLRHEGPVVWADVSHDNEHIATISRDKTVRIWEARSGKLLHTLVHAEEPYNFNSIQFSPDGRWLVTAAGNTAQVWDTHTGQPLTLPLKHDGRVNSVRFSPEGRRLVTASFGAARIWDVASGHLLSEPLQHRERVSYAEFSPDGRRVVTAAKDGTAGIWEVPYLPDSVPPWLDDWAEAVAAQRLDERGASQSLSFEALRRLRERLASSLDTDEATRWGRWFFAENATRTISPASALTVQRLVERWIEGHSLRDLEQAVRLAPTNGLAQARLAFLALTNETAPTERQTAQADWQSRQAVKLCPTDPEVWRLRAEICQRIGKPAEAVEALAARERVRAWPRLDSQQINRSER